MSGNTSAARSNRSTTEESIRYFHVISVGVICFLIGAITSFVILIHCQRISPALRLDLSNKPITTATTTGAGAVSTATEKRRDVIVTSEGGGATLQTVIMNDKMRTSSSDGSDAAFRPSVANSGETALVHWRQYYRRHYTGGVADTTYSRR